MVTFTSKPVVLDSAVDTILDKFSDLTRLQAVIDKVPAEERAKIGDVELTQDSIILKTQQVGNITLKITERSSERVVFTAVNAPAKMDLLINLKALSADSTELTAAMDVDIPPFLKSMVGGSLQKAVDQFGALMGRLL